MCAIQPVRDVFKAVAVKFPHRVLDDGPAVLELERWQGFLQVPAVRLADISRLRDLCDEGSDWSLSVFEIRGAHQVIGRAQLVGKVMEHEHTTAKAVRTHFEPGAIGRERVLADRPGEVCRRGKRGLDENSAVSILVTPLSVVEDDFEEPLGRLSPGLPCSERMIHVGPGVPVTDAFEIPVRLAAFRGAIALMGLRQIDSIIALFLVGIQDGVALVVIALADEPGKNLGWVGDAAVGGLAVQRGDVIFRD